MCGWMLVVQCVEMISRNALIYSSIKGTSFCESGVKVFKIIVANAGTMAAINILGTAPRSPIVPFTRG
jgi:hypothetical protein